MSLQASVPLLRVLLRKSVGQVRKVLKDGDWNLLKALVEIAHNLNLGNIDLTKSQALKVKKHRRFLAKLGDTKTSLTSKHIFLTRSKNVPKILKEILKIVVKQVEWLKEWL